MKTLPFARPLAAVLTGLAMVGTACLGPTQFDPTGSAPIGGVEIIADAGGGIRVVGWALDPDTHSSIKVKVGSEGIVKEVTASRSRPDIAAAYPGFGRSHGFDYTFGSLSPGLHGICVWVENAAGAGEDRLLGCDNIVVSDGTPVGNLDTVTSLAPRTATVSGWVFDQNSPDPAEIVVNIDGALAVRKKADGIRPDVGVAFGRSNVGFLIDFAAPVGRHQICVAVFNVGPGNDRLLGCRNVTIAGSTADRRPTGYLTAVTPTGPGSVDVAGVASDPDGSSGLKVRLDVDKGTPTAKSVTLAVAGGKFSTSLTGLAAGLHSICPVGLDVDGGTGVRGNREFVCGSTVVGDVAVGTGGRAGLATWVAPADGTALQKIDRDAGVSAELSDGSVMWFFGDSLETDNVGNLKYFVNNTAAWASAVSPTVTRDGVNAGKPYAFLRQSDYGEFCDGAKYPNEAMWPESAVTVPINSTQDRVLVFMSKVCLGNQFLQIEGRGMALAEYVYDRNAKPVNKEIRGTISAPALFGADKPYGRGAVMSADNSTIYTYQCGRFDGSKPGGGTAWGPCTVGRVAVGSRTTSSAWRYWNGGDWTAASSWVSNAASAAPMTTPTGNGVTIPVSAFTLTYDDVHGAYLMVYSPWPGFTDRVEVRVATSPAGPWTEPVDVFLPGCNDISGGVQYLCYAGTAQPKLSSTGLLGLGYYDQRVEVSGTRGQYITVTVPFSVLLTPGP